MSCFSLQILSETSSSGKYLASCSADTRINARASSYKVPIIFPDLKRDVSANVLKSPLHEFSLISSKLLSCYCSTHTCIHTWTYIPNQLTAWGSVLLEKLTVSQLREKLPAFYPIRRSITTFKAARYLPLSWARCICLRTSSSHLWLGLFPSLTLSTHLSSPLYLPPTQPISFCFVFCTHLEIYFVRCINYETSRYASPPPILLSFPPYLVQILSSAPASQICPDRFLTAVWETKFHTHTK
jgi:hypothetical protein